MPGCSKQRMPSFCETFRFHSGWQPVRVENSPQPNVAAAAPDAALMTIKMWAMVLLTGIGAGLTSGLLMSLLRLVQHLSFSYSIGDFLAGVRNTSGEHRIIVVSLAGVVTGLSLYLLRRITGSSGAEVTGAIWHNQGYFEAVPTTAKSLISIVIVGMGAAMGREAALKDMGATVAGKVSDWTSLSPEQRHLLVACGAGAGMAAAYNVPLGGALFAVEVLLGTMSLTNVLAAVITSFVAVAVSWLLLPNVPTFNVAQLSVTPSLLLWAAVAGPILGAASAVYVRRARCSSSNGSPRERPAARCSLSFSRPSG
jgi:chloride channel protein, CIC family